MVATWPDRDRVSAGDLTRALGGKWRGTNGAARCPAHEDRHPSLSLADGNDGKLLLRCHTGCSFEAIIDALKARGLLTDRQAVRLGRMHFGPPRASQPPPDPPQDAPSRIVAAYDYADESGAILYQSVRMEPKRFFQRRPNPHGGWIRNLEGVRLVLYRLPELLAAPANARVYIAEGEKDVERLRSLGLVATCNPMGAGKWRDEFSRWLAGRHVVVLPDNDDAGHRHAETVAESVRQHAASVHVVNLPHLNEKGDPSDWFENGGTTAELDRLVKEAEGKPPPAPRIAFLTSADLLLGESPPVPWVIAAPPDEHGNVRGGLLAERETGIVGAASGTGKTWLLADLVRALAMGEPLFDHFTVTRPLRVMLVDEESSIWLLRQRWALLLQGRGIGADRFAREVFDANIRIAVDQGFSFDDDGSLSALTEEALAFQPDIILFDTLARIHRRPENDNSQIAALFEDRIKPFKREVGCGLIFAHHVRKASKDAPNDPASLLRGASDLKGQLDQFWFLRGRSGDPRSIFEHDKCRAMPELPSFVLERETLPEGGIRLTHAGEALSASATAAEMNREVILRYLIDNGQQSREEIFAYGKTRGMGERTVANVLSALLESEDVDRARVGHKAVYWASEME